MMIGTLQVAGGRGPVATGTLGPVLRSHWLAGPGVLARYWPAGHVTGAACTVDWGGGAARGWGHCGGVCAARHGRSLQPSLDLLYSR